MILDVDYASIGRHIHKGAAAAGGGERRGRGVFRLHR